MPNISQPQRQDEPAVTDADLAALLAGSQDAASGLRPVEDVLAALTAEATAEELAGEAHALAAFRRLAGAQVPAGHARRRTGRRSSRLGVKVGASVAAVALVIGSGAAAAFADVLPAPIQRLAHDAIGAPTPRSQRGLPHHGRPAPDARVMYGQPAHNKPAARGGHGAKRQPRPHPTPTPTPQGNPHAQGGRGSSHGKGQHGQGSGKGHKGSGQEQGNGQSQSNDHRQSSRQAHGTAKTRGRGQGVSPFGRGHRWNPHHWGPHGSPQPNWRPAGHPRRWFFLTRPVMDL